MKLIIGLGNHEVIYKHTRHNLGERIMRAFFDASEGKIQPFSFTASLRGETAKLRTHDEQVLFLFPHTYMNHSGEAVQATISYYHLQTEDLWVMHDDVDIPFGEIRVQQGRSSAGHNGVQSIIDHLGTNAFWRLRIGIRQEDGAVDMEKFVLQKFTKEEKEQLPKIAELAIAELNKALAAGIQPTTVRVE